MLQFSLVDLVGRMSGHTHCKAYALLYPVHPNGYTVNNRAKTCPGGYVNVLHIECGNTSVDPLAQWRDELRVQTPFLQRVVYWRLTNPTLVVRYLHLQDQQVRKYP